MKKEQGKSVNLHIRFMLFVVVLLMGIVSVQVTNLYAKNLALKEERIALEKAIECELDQNMDLIAQRKYMYTDEYVEQIAREKLGLIMPDEIIFINEN